MILYALEFLIGEDFDMINILCLFFLLFHIWNFMSCMYQGTTFVASKGLMRRGKLKLKDAGEERAAIACNYCI